MDRWYYVRSQSQSTLVAYMYEYLVSLCATITEYDKLAMVHCMVQYHTTRYVLPGTVVLTRWEIPCESKVKSFDVLALLVRASSRVARAA